jgi:pimeloyl-ACP methyl ester carboxylesterase
MGGYVALDAANKAKDLFSGIITLGTKFKWSEDFTTKETAKLQAQVLLQKAPDFVSLLIQKHGPAWESLLAHTAEMMRDLQTTHLDFIRVFNAIKIPVAIGRGDKDKMVTEEESRMAQQNIQGADYFELPESSHGFETIKHAALAEWLIQFMNKHTTNEAPANDSHRV